VFSTAVDLSGSVEYEIIYTDDVKKKKRNKSTYMEICFQLIPIRHFNVKGNTYFQKHMFKSHFPQAI
jgi:hypothetical protein